MLATNKLVFQYQNGPSFQFEDVHCPAGEHLLILGESGRGKTTLLHLLAGLLKPTIGEVLVANTNIASLQSAALDKFRGEHIGIVFQTAHFVESLSVEDNLVMPQYLTGKPLDRNRVKELLKRLNLEHRAQARPATLSVGEQQRAAIARALVNAPQVVLADEPTSALDDKNAAEVIALLKEHAAWSKASLVIVTHDQRLKNEFKHQIHL